MFACPALRRLQNAMHVVQSSFLSTDAVVIRDRLSGARDRSWRVDGSHCGRSVAVPGVLAVVRSRAALPRLRVRRRAPCGATMRGRAAVVGPDRGWPLAGLARRRCRALPRTPPISPFTFLSTLSQWIASGPPLGGLLAFARWPCVAQRGCSPTSSARSHA